MNLINNNGIFYYEPILQVKDYKNKISNFEIYRKKGKGLEVYLKYYAINDEVNGIARTYLVLDNITHELVGYFTIKTGDITVNERRRGLFNTVEFDSIPGAELSNFAVNDIYKKKNKMMIGIGQIILFDFVIPLIEEIAKYIGLKVLYIFALPEENLINRYKQMNFQRLSKKQERILHKRIKPAYDKNCIFMYQVVNTVQNNE